MKALIKLLLIFVCLGLFFWSTSCIVLIPQDSGNHKGWYKNPNNPHNPYTTNPGKAVKNPKK